MPVPILSGGLRAEVLRTIFTEPPTPHAFLDKQVPDEELRAIWEQLEYLRRGPRRDPGEVMTWA
jgi:hypothetical protein